MHYIGQSILKLKLKQKFIPIHEFTRVATMFDGHDVWSLKVKEQIKLWLSNDIYLDFSLNLFPILMLWYKKSVLLHRTNFKFEIESIKFKLLQAVATRMRFRSAVIIKWYAHGMLIFVCGFCIVVSATILK